MPYPAYEGLTFYFSITRGTAWTQEFRVIDRSAPGDTVGSWTGWAASMTISDNDGTILLTLSTDDGDGGGDGTIALGDPDLGNDAIVCHLGADKTALLPATGTPAGRVDKPFLHALLTLTDPTHPGEPYPFAVGKGVTRNPPIDSPT